MTAIVPSQTVLWAGCEAPPGALRDLLSELGYTLYGRDLDSWPARRVAWLSALQLQGLSTYDLDQRRIAVVHPEPGAADALAEALRARGAQAIVIGVGEAGLERAEALEPDAVILQPERFWSDGRSVIAALWQHPWLRWTPVLFVPAQRLGRAAASAPDVRELALGVHALCADYDLVLRRASRKETFELRLSQLGPVRTLRALLESQRPLRLTLEAPERVYELDLGHGLVIGARVRMQRGAGWEELLGTHAMKSFLARMDGRVRVVPVAHPELTNLMTPLDVLLLGGREAPRMGQPAPSAAGTQVSASSRPAVVGLYTPVMRSQRSGPPAAAAPPVPGADEAVAAAGAAPVPRWWRAIASKRRLALVAALLTALAGAFYAGRCAQDDRGLRRPSDTRSARPGESSHSWSLSASLARRSRL